MAISYSDWIKQQSAAPVAPKSQALSNSLAELGSLSQKKAEGNALGPVGTLFDLLSRPLYAVTNPLYQSQRRDIEKDQALAEGKSTEGLENNPLTFLGDIVGGFFGTDPDGQRPNAAVQRDLNALRNKNNPNYKPSDDQVGEAATGLGMDILLDPLTYLTGGIAAGVKAIGGAVKGAKGVTTATEAASRLGKAEEGVSAARTLDDELGDALKNTTFADEVAETPLPAPKTAEQAPIAPAAEAPNPFSALSADDAAVMRNFGDPTEVPRLVDAPAARAPELQTPRGFISPAQVAENSASAAAAAARTPEGILDAAASTIRGKNAAVTPLLDTLAGWKDAGPRVQAAKTGIQDWIRQSVADPKAMVDYNGRKRPILEVVNISQGRPARTERGIQAIVPDAEAQKSARDAIIRAYKASPAGASVVAEAERAGKPYASWMDMFKGENALRGDLENTLPPQVYATLQDQLAKGDPKFERSVDTLMRTFGTKYADLKGGIFTSPAVDQGVLGHILLDVYGTSRQGLAARKSIAGSQQRILDDMREAAKNPARQAYANIVFGYIDDWADISNFKYGRKSSARGTTEKIYGGDAKYVSEVNAQHQYNLLKTINSKFGIAKTGAPVKVLKEEFDNFIRARAKRTESRLDQNSATIETRFGKARAKDVLDFQLEKFRQAESYMATMGMRPIVNVGEYGGQRIPGYEDVALSWADVVETLKGAGWDTPEGQVVLQLIGQYKIAVGPTPLMKAVADAANGAGREGIEAALRWTTKDGKGNNLVTGPSKLTSLAGNKQVVTEFTPDQRVAALADLIEAKMPELLEINARNKAAYAKRWNAESMKLTDEALVGIKAMLDTRDATQIARYLSKQAKETVEDAHAAGQFAESAFLANHLVDERIRRVIDEHVAETARKISQADHDINKAVDDAVAALPVKASPKTVAAAAKAKLKEADVSVVQKQHANTSKEVLEEAQEFAQSRKEQTATLVREALDAGDAQTARNAIGNEFDLSTMAPYDRVQEGFWRTADPIGHLRKAFDRTFGMELTNSLVYGNMVGSQRFAALAKSQLMEIQRLAGLKRHDAIDGSILPKAFNDMQHGHFIDPVTAEAATGYQRVMETMFAVDGDGLQSGAFMRNALDPDTFNGYLKRNGIKPSDLGLGADELPFDLERATERAAVNGTTPQYEMANEWRTWNVGNPQDVMAKLSQAAADLGYDKALAADLKTYAVKNDFFSETPLPGFVKVTASGETRIGNFIPDGYYPKELAQEFKAVDAFLKAPRQVRAKVVREYYVPALQLWKRTITLPRPGHHIRNMIGNISLQHVTQGLKNLTRSQDDARRVLALRKQYDGVDILQGLDRRYGAELPKDGDVLFSAGKHGDFKVDELYAAADDRGLFPTYQSGESLFADELGTGKFSLLTQKASLQDNRFGDTLGSLSEYLDHQSRLANFTQFIRNNADRFATKDELFNAAAKRVYKNNPDGNMLTPFESRVMRNIFPFYSWFRGVLPAIAEAVMMHPERIMLYPKLSYAAAQANGVNPDTFADPWPDDQLFPSFLTEDGIGPQFKLGDNYMRVQPGIAHLDVFSTLASPVEGVAGMVSPLLKAPIELATGSYLGSGGRKINDVSDYLDSQIPGINYVSSVSGYSPTGTVAGLLSGSGAEQQASVEKGDRTAGDQGLSAFNWLTGLGVGNMSRESFQKIAQFEQREKAREEARRGD